MLFSWEEKSRSNNSSRIQLNFYHSYRSIQPASHFLCAYLVSGCSGGRLSKVFQTSLPHQQRFPDPPGGDPEAFWGQMTYAVPPARSGSAPGGSSRLAVPWKSLQREAPGRILIRCPNHLNQLSFFFLALNDQRLHSKLPSGCPSSSTRSLNPATPQKNFSLLNSQSHSFGQ